MALTNQFNGQQTKKVGLIRRHHPYQLIQRLQIHAMDFLFYEIMLKLQLYSKYFYNFFNVWPSELNFNIFLILWTVCVF